MFPKEVFTERRQLHDAIQKLSPDQLKDNAQALLIIVGELERSLELELRIIQQVKNLALDDSRAVGDFANSFEDYVGQRRFNLERTSCGRIGRIYRQQISAGATGPGLYTHYELGLQVLLLQLKNRKDARYGEALIYQQQLTENIDSAIRYGETSDTTHRRAIIIDNLNHLALDRLGESFNDVCKRSRLTAGQAPANPVSRELDIFLAQFEHADAEFTEQIEPVMQRALEAVQTINAHVQNGELAEARRYQQEFDHEYKRELHRVGQAIDEMTQVGNQLLDLLE
ncbi:MAG: hypothetical protein ABIV47_00030 [Roseiflexaceae bacterium]